MPPQERHPGEDALAAVRAVAARRWRRALAAVVERPGVQRTAVRMRDSLGRIIREDAGAAGRTPEPEILEGEVVSEESHETRGEARWRS